MHKRIPLLDFYKETIRLESIQPITRNIELYLNLIMRFDFGML